MTRSTPALWLLTLALVACGGGSGGGATDDVASDVVDAPSAPEDTWTGPEEDAGPAPEADAVSDDAGGEVEDVSEPEDAETEADAAGVDAEDTGPPPEVDEDEPPLMVCATGAVTSTLPASAWRVAVRTTDDPAAFGLHLEQSPAHAHENFPAAPQVVEADVVADAVVTPLAWTLTFDGGVIDVARGSGEDLFFTGTATIGADEDVGIACWTPGLELPFTYDAEVGHCFDSLGGAGVNAGVPLAFVRDTADGQCVDLVGVDLVEGDTAYPQLEGWDLRGARLDDARLFFASLVDAQLEGADLSSMKYGYAMITGTVDPFTLLPKGCSLEEATVSCVQ